jgi:hypothetical protein
VLNALTTVRHEAFRYGNSSTRNGSCTRPVDTALNDCAEKVTATGIASCTRHPLASSCQERRVHLDHDEIGGVLLTNTKACAKGQSSSYVRAERTLLAPICEMWSK